MSKPYGEVNVEMFQEIKRIILEEPRRLNMSDWGKQVDQRSYLSPPCGTVACIAGWALKLDYDEKGEKGVMRWSNEKKAANLLGISTWVADKVFYVSNWPRDFMRAYAEAVGPIARAKITAEYIDYICGVETNV